MTHFGARAPEVPELISCRGPLKVFFSHGMPWKLRRLRPWCWFFLNRVFSPSSFESILCETDNKWFLFRSLFTLPARPPRLQANKDAWTRSCQGQECASNQLLSYWGRPLPACVKLAGLSIFPRRRRADSCASRPLNSCQRRSVILSAGTVRAFFLSSASRNVNSGQFGVSDQVFA